MSPYLIPVNQSKIHAWLPDVKVLTCEEKWFIKLFELLSEGLEPHPYTSASTSVMFHLSAMLELSSTSAEAANVSILCLRCLFLV